MRSPNELDQAALKVEFKQLIKEIGVMGVFYALHEMILASAILAEALTETIDNGRKS